VTQLIKEESVEVGVSGQSKPCQSGNATMSHFEGYTSKLSGMNCIL